MRMHHIVICGLPRLTIFFHIISQTAQLKKKLLNTKCVFWFSLQILSETFIILRRNERDMIKNVHWTSCTVPFILVQYPLFLSDFNETWIFSTDFRKILKYQISWKSVRWEPSCSMGMDERTDMTKLRFAFRNSANTLKKLNIREITVTVGPTVQRDVISHLVDTPRNLIPTKYLLSLCSTECVAFLSWCLSVESL
jgi:hypothetical protein